MPPQRHPWIIPIIVGTIGVIAIATVGTICACSIWGISPGPDVKEMAIASLAAITALLARTSSPQESPVDTRVVNKSDDPVSTNPQ